MSPLSLAATTREGVHEARKLGRLSRSMASRPPGRRAPAIPTRTARLPASSKSASAVDQCTSRPKRPAHGSWRVAPATYSPLALAAAAPGRDRSRNAAEESRPVTSQPRAASWPAISPCPQARSSTLMPGRRSSNRQASSAAVSPGTPAPGTAGPWDANLLVPSSAAKKDRESSSCICAASHDRDHRENPHGKNSHTHDPPYEPRAGRAGTKGPSEEVKAEQGHGPAGQHAGRAAARMPPGRPLGLASPAPWGPRHVLRAPP